MNKIRWITFVPAFLIMNGISKISISLLLHWASEIMSTLLVILVGIAVISIYAVIIFLSTFICPDRKEGAIICMVVEWVLIAFVLSYTKESLDNFGLAVTISVEITCTFALLVSWSGILSSLITKPIKDKTVLDLPE